MTHEFLDPERHRDPAIGPRAVDPVRLHPPGSTAAGCQCGRPPGLSASRRRDVPGGLGARSTGRRPGLARRLALRALSERDERHAVHLLRTGTDSVEWVAAQIGYADGATLRYC